MPGVTWKPLKENTWQPAITPTQVILHTAVDAPGETNLHGYFNRSDVTVESHFWIPLDGEIIQMMDTNIRADANLYANARAISIETEDEGDPVGIPWSAAQLESIIKIIRWAHGTHNIPMTKCAAWNQPGIGWHAMWGAPSKWTPARGKTCPGPTRIAQINNVILPVLSDTGTPMSPAAARKFAQSLYLAILHRSGDPSGINYWAKIGEEHGEMATFAAFINSAAGEVGGLTALVGDISNSVSALAVRVHELETTVSSLKSQEGPNDIPAVIDELIHRLTNG